ncbi:amidophosphoribosyltransferase [Micromonospora polyrhachis]|uniref:amidophosphoribosyltransferase n=1 Tax=Micromonospora polyrhachis TaxID=1282883 RepID=UPI00161A2A02
MRTFLAVAAGLAVIYFGSQPPEGGGVTNALVVLGLVAAALVWFLTKPKSDKPVS